MTRKLFTLLALCLTTVFAVKAEKEVYTEFKDGTLTYYYDDQRASRTGITEVYDPVNNPNAVRFKECDTQVKKAVIDVSMKDAHLNSTYKMFYGGYESKSYKLSNMTEIVGMENLVTDEVWSMSCMFQFCSSLSTIDLSSFNTDNVTDMWGMFYLCYGLTSLDVSKFNTENVYDMGYMFSNCDALPSLDLSNFDISKVTSMESMFAYSSGLTTITCNGKWSESTTLINSTDMFKGCTSLVGGNGTTCDGENNTNAAYAHPDGGEGNPGYFTAKNSGDDSGENPGEDPADDPDPDPSLGDGSPVIYTAFNASKGVLTYYYDDLKDAREDVIIELYDPENTPEAVRFAGYYDQVKIAKIHASMQNAHLTSTYYMFYGGYGDEMYNLPAMTKIVGMENLVTDEVENMSYMFVNCTALTTVDFSHFNTANVTEMNGMFSGCSALTSLDLSNFSNAKVTDMNGMFYGCSSLISLNLNSFGTANVTDMAEMFEECLSLQSLDLTSFNTSSVTTMKYMFSGCKALTSINLNSFNTSNVRDMSLMFNECSSLTSLDLSSFNTSKVTTMRFMFAYCPALTSINLSSFNTANVTQMDVMFCGCSSLASLDLSNFNTAKVANMYNMFASCASLTSLDLSSFNTENVTSMSGMFYACDRLTSINFGSSFNTAKVKSMRQMFLRCNFTELDLSQFNTSSVTDMKGMFASCTQLRSIKFGQNFTTANVTSMNNMFMHCYYLSALDLRTFNITKVTDTESMFEECQRLKTIWCAGNWSQSATLTNSANMFKGCSSLEGDKGTTCDGVTDIDKTYARPDEGATAPGYFTAEKVEGDDEVYTFFKDGVLTYLYDNLRNFRTGGITELYDPVNDGAKLRFQGYNDQITKVVIDESMKKAHLTSAYRMFFGGFLDNQVIDEFYSNKLSELIEIVGMNNLVTDEVTDMQYMFYGCSKLASLDARYFKTARVINFGCMFQGCSSLPELDLRNFNIDRAAYIYGMFYECTALRSIYCDADWSQSSAASVGMFHNCTSIVGGMGSTYDPNHTDAAYARLDRGSQMKGYFTGEVPVELYTIFDAATGTLTYYYDNLRYTREGISEGYDPVNNPTAKRFEGYNDQVTKAVIHESMKNAHLTSTYSMFYNLTAMTEIEDMENLVTDEVTDMSYMFNNCESLTSLNLSHFNTENVMYMRSMFQMCNALESIDLSKFNTEKVTNMNRMFFGCYRLVSLDLSKFNTSSVTDMGGMFTHCTSLTELDLNPFDIAKVQYMNGMFYGCTALKTIYCSKVWSQSTVVADSEEMFKGCSALVGVLGTKCDGENHIDMSYAHPDLGKYNPGYFTWNVVTPIKVYTEFDAASGTLTYYYDDQYYYRDGKVEFYDPFDDGERRFKNYHDQVTKAVIDESMRNAHLTSAYSMFYGGNERTGSGRVLYYALTSMTAIEGMENLVTDEVENMTDMFNRCSAITDIDLRGFNTENVTAMQSMFEGCSSLASLDLTPFNIAKVTDMRWMFKNCSALKTILCKNYWNQSAVTSDYSFEMFNGCTSIVGGKGTTYDENHTDITYARPDGGTKQPGYFFEQKAEVYTAFDATTGILTYYYDDQRAARTAAGEITELYEPVKNPGAIRFKDYHNQVLKAVIDESMKEAGLTSTRNMFYGGDETIDGIVYSNNMSAMTEISGLKNLVTDEVKDMSYMFNQCYSLGNVDFSDFNTSNATDMSYMFSQCYTLKTLDLSNFNTQNVTNMSYMFYQCHALKSLNLNGLDTRNVTDMSSTFYQCYALKTLDLSNFNMQNVTNMSYMFYQCHTLESLNLNGLDTRNVTDMSSMFYQCYALKTLDLSNFNTQNVTNMSYMFHWCGNLKTILCNDDWSKSKVLTDSENMFSGCTSLVGGNGTTYDADHTDVAYARPDGEKWQPGYFFKKKTEVYTAFNETTGVLTYYYDDQRAAHRAAGEITEVYGPVNNPALRFKDYHDQVLKAVIHESMKDAELTSMLRMFYGGYYEPDKINCTLTNMTEIVGLENLVTDKVVDMEYLFWGCSKLASLDLSSFNTVNVKDMSDMFYLCGSLSSLDLSSFNTDNVTDMSYMFYVCGSLSSLDVTSFNTSNVEDMSSMFSGCKSLTSVDLSSFNTANVKYMLGMFYGSALTSLDLSSFNTANVTNMDYMFGECSALTSLDLSSFNTDKVTSMEKMFKNCSSLKTILCNDDWSKSTVLQNSDDIFYGCESLVGGNGTKYDANYTDIDYAHVDGEDGKPGYFTSNAQLKPLPNDETTTFDFSLYDPAGSELLGVTLGAKDQYNATEGRMEISSTNTEEEIDEKLNAAFAGAASFKSLLPGTICFKLEKGKGEIEIDCQTVPGYTLQVRIAEYGTAYISSTVEQAQRGKATVNYDVTQPTYVVIYLQGVSTASSKISARIVTSKTAANEEGDEDDIDDDEEEPAEVGAYIYSITITPNTTDDIEQPNGSPSDCLSVRKLLIDGHVYILLPDGTMYNSTGAKVVGE